MTATLLLSVQTHKDHLLVPVIQDTLEMENHAQVSSTLWIVYIMSVYILGETDFLK